MSGIFENFELNDLPLPAILQVLLNIPPEYLHIMACLNKKIASVCSSSSFINLYRLKVADCNFINVLIASINNGNCLFYKKWYKYERWDPSYNDNLAIKLSSQYGHIEIVKLLLTDPRVDPSAQTNLAISLTSENGQIEMVKLLLTDPRVNPSDRNNYSIRLASLRGHTEVVKLLLTDPRVDPSSEDNLAIRWAFQKGHTEIVKLLLDDPRVGPSANNLRHYLYSPL